MGQLHLYLDDMFPNSIGRPLINTAVVASKPGGL
jgi:hypothetical protein